MNSIITTFSICTILSVTISAEAQDKDVADAEATRETPEKSDTEPAKTKPAEKSNPTDSSLSSEAGGDGGRFRFGVAVGAGPLSTEGIKFTYYGVDLRFGWQINNAIAVYAQPQIGYYKLDGASAALGSGGLVGTSILADYTLFDRLFLGGGLGYAVLNNPSGTEVHLRAGGYPLMSRSDSKVRRTGLMLGVDFRLHFVDGYTFVAPTFNLGYDAF
jgi:hypothetical protein